MADLFSKEKRSQVMSHIRSKNTLIERTVFRFLRRNKVHFVSHYNRIPGKPDVARPREKKAVFLDGDFWHGRDFLIRKEKLPQYWVSKISGNIARDRKHRLAIRKKGWRILRIWEHDLEKREEEVLKKILRFLKE